MFPTAGFWTAVEGVLAGKRDAIGFASACVLALSIGDANVRVSRPPVYGEIISLCGGDSPSS